MRAVSVLAVVAVTLLWGLPGTAGAATVSVRSVTVDYEAAPGERNDVALWVDSEAHMLNIADPGATVTTGASCTSVDAHTARCGPFDDPFAFARVRLGDMDDVVRGAPPDPGFAHNWIVLFTDGGPGDDTLDGRSNVQSELDGGGGTDRLLGGGFTDFLTDGDRDDAPAGLGPGPDLLDGGAGGDWLSYRRRTAPVTVDLAESLGHGAAGENDTVVAIEAVVGGSGDDRLAGDDGHNGLDGGEGRDVLIGRGGSDEFGSSVDLAPFDPSLPLYRFAGTGAFPEPAATGDAVRCSEGADVIWGLRARDFVRRGCETIVLRRPLPFDPATLQGTSGDSTIYLPAYPTIDGSGIKYRFRCADPEDWLNYERVRDLGCTGRITLRERSEDRRLLARGRIRLRGLGSMRSRLRLTPLGERLAGRARGVRARFRLSAESVPTVRWTIRFKLD